MSKTKPWKFLEGVVAAIERSRADAPGTVVTPNAMVRERVSGKLRQVDILVEVPAGPRTLRIAVEVKDWASKLDIVQIEQLTAKFAKLDIDRGCVVSATGYSTDARRDAANAGVETLTLAEVSAPNWWKPSSIAIVRQSAELLHVRIGFDDETVRALGVDVGQVKTGDVRIVVPPNGPERLTTFVAAQGLKAIEAHNFTDKELFRVTMNFELPAGSHLLIADRHAPLPPTILAIFRMHCSVEPVPLTPFLLDGRVNAFSGVSEVDAKQLTFVTTEQKDGTRVIAVTLSDAVPPRATASSGADSE